MVTFLISITQHYTQYIMFFYFYLYISIHNIQHIYSLYASTYFKTINFQKLYIKFSKNTAKKYRLEFYKLHINFYSNIFNRAYDRNTNYLNSMHMCCNKKKKKIVSDKIPSRKSENLFFAQRVLYTVLYIYFYSGFLSGWWW